MLTACKKTWTGTVMYITSPVNASELLAGDNNYPAAIWYIVVFALGDQVKLLTSNGSVAFLQSYRNKIKSEVTSPEIGNVEAYVRRGSTLDLNRGGCSGGGCIKGRA